MKNEINILEMAKNSGQTENDRNMKAMSDAAVAQALKGATTKIIELTLNGFHGYRTHNVRAKFTPRPVSKDGLSFSEKNENGFYVKIAQSAADKFLCPSKDCLCGDGVPTQFHCCDADFKKGSIERKGCYSQD